MKRWIIIRHLRYIWQSFRFWRWWNRVGSQYWLVPNPDDIEYLRGIWEGKR